MKILLDSRAFQEAVRSLGKQILNKHPSLSNVAIIGIQQGGVVLADVLVKFLGEQLKDVPVSYGQLDITFYRDDLHQKILSPDKMNIPFAIDGLQVILVDDVLFTGRTIKAALDVLLDYGRPARVELCVLADRKEHRQFPIQADYRALEVATEASDKVKVMKDEAGETAVVLISPEN